MIRSVQTIIQNKVQATSLRQALKLGQTLVQIIKTELYEQTALTVQTKEQVIAKSRMQNERTLLRAKAETARERLESEIAAEQQRKGLVVLSVENRKQEADGQDIVVVIGQDGLVANTLKYLDGQPVIAINPDPALGWAFIAFWNARFKVYRQAHHGRQRRQQSHHLCRSQN